MEGDLAKNHRLTICRQFSIRLNSLEATSRGATLRKNFFLLLVIARSVATWQSDYPHEIFWLSFHLSLRERSTRALGAAGEGELNISIICFQN